MPTPAWEFFLIESQCNNTPSKLQIFQVHITFIIPKLMEFFYMPKELNGWSDRVLSHWSPMGKSSQVGAGNEESVGGGGGSSRMKTWSSPGLFQYHSLIAIGQFNIWPQICYMKRGKFGIIRGIRCFNHLLGQGRIIAYESTSHPSNITSRLL